MSIFDDPPNTYVTEKMLELLRKSLTLESQYVYVPRSFIGTLLERLHILKRRYVARPELPTSKTLKLHRYQHLKLPTEDKQ